MLSLEIKQEYVNTWVASAKNMLISPMTAISGLWSHWLSPLTNSRFIPSTENTPESGYFLHFKSRESLSTWWRSHWSLKFVLPSLSFASTEPDGDGNGGSSGQEYKRFSLLWPKIFQTSMFLRLFYAFGKFPECLKWLILLVFIQLNRYFEGRGIAHLLTWLLLDS